MFICPSVVFVLIASVFAQSLQQNAGPEFRRLPSPTNFMQSKPGVATNSAPWASDRTKSAGSPCQMNPRRFWAYSGVIRGQVGYQQRLFRSGALYSEYVNPQWVRLLDLLEMNVRYERCSGSELFADGRRILDFLSGYCVHNVGHNHPAVIAALHEELEREGPAMVQTHVAESAGELAEKLCLRAGGRLTKVFFGSSGSEGIEAAIKFSRAHTGRPGLLYAYGAFHGLTCGALSLMGDPFWREGFGPLLPETEAIPFDDLDALERKLASRRFAAFIVEPIQSEAGVRVPTPDYFRAAQSLCRRYGTLLVLDEVQTGMCRTGPFLAAQRFGVDPDMVVLAKAMSGGLVPVSAVLMTDAIYNSVYGSLRRAIIHTSTFSENGLAMRAALATLEVLEAEKLGPRAIEAGKKLRTRLQEALGEYEMVKTVRGEGLLLGVEFTALRSLRLRIPFEAFMHIHPAMFGQIIVMHLFRDSGILTQICGNNFMVLKVAPPLVVTDGQIDEFVCAIEEVVELAHSSNSFWSEAPASRGERSTFDSLGEARGVLRRILRELY